MRITIQQVKSVMYQNLHQYAEDSDLKKLIEI